jgi:hypothetical protein
MRQWVCTCSQYTLPIIAITLRRWVPQAPPTAPRAAEHGIYAAVGQGGEEMWQSQRIAKNSKIVLKGFSTHPPNARK